MAILSNTEFGILRLTISRAQKRNSINAEMFDTMTEALSRAASDDAVRVVLLQGGEQIFSAGADLEEMRSQPEVCLLYTSPSPRDGLLSRMPSSA